MKWNAIMLKAKEIFRVVEVSVPFFNIQNVLPSIDIFLWMMEVNKVQSVSHSIFVSITTKTLETRALFNIQVCFLVVCVAPKKYRMKVMIGFETKS